MGDAGRGVIPDSELFPVLSRGIRWGLGRTRGALAELGDPHRRFPSVHVGGTNGKGSVAATVARVLQLGGHRVGLFTSPHLIELRERFQIDGRPVSRERIEEAAAAIRPALARHRLTFFEATAVLAFRLFADEEVDVAVVEVGLGGRLDATNVLEPEVSCITNVALDHAEYLGHTLPEIAAEKAGIVKAGVPLVTGVEDSELIGILRAVAAEKGAPLIGVHPREDLEEVRLDADGTAFTLRTERWGSLALRTPLPGRHQAANVALAVRILERLPEPFRPTVERLREGVETVVWPGRFQRVRRDDVLWLFDIAHNPAAARALAETLELTDSAGPHVLLFGVLTDKDWAAMLPPLLRRVDRVILATPPTSPKERRWDPDEALVAVPGRFEAEVIEEWDEAVARTASAARGGTALAAGSCHTVGDAMATLGIDPYDG